MATKAIWKLKTDVCPTCGYSRKGGYTHHGATLADRFWAKVKKATGNRCWLWTASNLRGYGIFGIGRKSYLAHRVAWFLSTGIWPNKQVLHTCDTPSCVRFSHLYLGTQAENMKDMIQKGRGAWQK